MADVSEDVLIKDAATAISQGKRHLLVRDYNLAVVALARACEFLAQEHGETGDEMGELYLLYGRALLGLAREEAGVLGGGVPGSEEVSQDEEAQEEEAQEEEAQEEEEEEDAEEETTVATSPSTSNGKESSNKQEQPDEKESKDATEKDEKKTEESDRVNDTKKKEVHKKQKEEIPGCSRDLDMNGEPSSNGKKIEDDSESVDKENDEDDVNNLQIAWEVLELAKLVLLKRGSSGWKYLAEAYRLLGEVAMEGGNHETALIDLRGCLDLLHKITPPDHRAIAEIHYQLGLAYAMANDFDASIEQFKQASALLETRIVHLQNTQNDLPPESDDPFYTVEGEIKELKDLLPEIQDKITDIKDLKKEAGIIKEIKEEALNDTAETNDGAGNDTTSKPASDISHLVRKKRKAEDEADPANVCKKPAAQPKDA